MDDEMREYVIFTDTTKDGAEIELAVVEEFEFNHKHYVVAALVENDEISEDSLFIYGVKKNTDEFVPEKITDEKEYEAAAAAYLDLSDEAR